MRLTFGLAALAAGLALAPASAAETCLALNQLKTLSFVDDTTIRASTRRDVSFEVKLSRQCGYDKFDQALVLRRDHLGRCLAERDVLYTLDGAPCFVESVTPVPAG